ncbi:MAG: transposase [Bdellovibrionales bacterium]|nr:transposase [Bdellovibrionales bacterium]
MSWIDDELSTYRFSDNRFGKRLVKLIQQLADKMGNSIPTACQDWANTKTAYRLFSISNLNYYRIHWQKPLMITNESHTTFYHQIL